MVTSLRLICGPTRSGKTHEAIRAFLKAVEGDRHPVFIAPSLPDARHFEREILRQSLRGVLTGGEVTTFGDYFGSILRRLEPAARILSPSERFLLMRMVVDRNSGLSVLAGSADFDGFVASLIEVVAELQALGIDAGGMGTLKCWTQGHDWRQALSQDLFLLYDDYLAALREQGVYDEERAQRRVIEALASDSAVAGTAFLVIDGFWEFTPLQLGLIRALGEAGSELVVTLPFEQGSDRFESLGRQFETLCQGAEVIELPAREDEKRAAALRHLDRRLFANGLSQQVPAGGAVATLTAAGNRGQAELVAAEILKLARSGKKLDDIAIVCRRMGPEMEAMAAALRELGVPFEMHAPVELRNTTVGRAALAALDLVGGAGRTAMTAFLRNARALEPGEAIDEFDRAARIRGIDDAPGLRRLWQKHHEGKPQPETERLAAAAGRGLPDLGQELCGVMSEAVSRSFPGAGVAEAGMDLLALKCLNQVCHEAAQAEEAAASIATAGGRSLNAATLLRRGIEAAQFYPPGAVRRGCVRLLDPHRVLNQRFETIFVCSLQERQFPALGRENAFFSDGDRRLLREQGILLETREHRLSEERFLFHRTLSRARKKIYLCYPYCDKDGTPAVRSLFVDDALAQLEPGSWDEVHRPLSRVAFAIDEAPTPDLAVRALAEFAGRHDLNRQPASLERAAAAAGLAERLRNCLNAPGGTCRPLTDPVILKRLKETDEFHVTGLQSYLRCPVSYFIKYVLEPREMEPAAHTLRRGQAAHDILCNFGEQILIRSEVILADADDAQLEEARRQMLSAIEVEFDGAGDDLETLILKTELETQLLRFIDREKEGGRRLMTFDLELSFGSPRESCGGRHSTAQMLQIGDVRLKGRLDRVDWTDRNRAIVMDFKTSKKVSSWKDFSREKEIQIPLYILALRHVFGFEPLGGEYYALRGTQRRGLYLAGSAEQLGADAGNGQMHAADFVEPEVFEEMLQAASDAARDAAAAIRRGEFPCPGAEAKPKCDWCSYGDICRFGEKKRMVVSNDESYD